MNLFHYPLVAAVLLPLATPIASAVPGDSHYVPPSKEGINRDAMTMQECRDRLAAPVKERPPSDDPSIDKDAICKNMLSVDKQSHKPTSKKPGNAASKPTGG